MSIVLIGDVHGKTGTYQKIVRRLPEGQRSIQIGDMGIEFNGVGLHEMPLEHRWFRGNHDCPEKCRANKNYLGDYGYLEADRLFYIAGAVSIDHEMRVEGISWWRDEELSYLELKAAIDLYAEKKPRYVISHEAPSSAGRVLLVDLIGQYFAAKGDCCNSRTANALQCMLELHQPKERVFGHYHIDKSFELLGTKFTCVAELSRYELNTEA